MKRYRLKYMNGIEQELVLITRKQYCDYKQCMSQLEQLESAKNKKNKEEIQPRIDALKHIINLFYSDNFMVEGSPMYHALITGCINLPDYQGGKHYVEVKRL